jgi:hypothetical protein
VCFFWGARLAAGFGVPLRLHWVGGLCNPFLKMSFLGGVGVFTFGENCLNGYKDEHT